MKKCYAAGGKTRDVGGIKAPAYGTNTKVMDMAKGATTGKVGMGGIGVDGVPKGRTDRPGRRMGGRAKGKC